jgi:hypothetical protein
MSHLEEWQVDLAREAAAGRGIDALSRILTEIRDRYAANGDEGGLADAIQQINDCAYRHLTDYKSETIETIFNGVFPPNNGPHNALDEITLNKDANAEIQRLATLPIVQYERERILSAERLGLRTRVLDRCVKDARHSETKVQGRAFELPSIEPWGEPVAGSELVDEISDTIGLYVVMSPESKGTLALWSLHTHCFDCFSHSPRAAIVSPEKQCGKTTTLDVLSCIVARPLPTANAGKNTPR